MTYTSVVLDVDSTLCGVEGIDWLAQRRGGDVAREIAELTARAMNGDIKLETIYGKRLEVISPTRADVNALARTYRETLAPGASDAIARLRAAGVHVVLVSGGIRQAIQPLANDLGVELHAVDVYFDTSSNYGDYDRRSPLTSQRGKLVVVRTLALPRPTLAVGDGATDLAMRAAADGFAAYTGFVKRDTVVAQADRELSSYDQLAELVLRQP